MSVSDTAVAVAAARPLGAPLVRDAAPADYPAIRHVIIAAYRQYAGEVIPMMVDWLLRLVLPDAPVEVRERVAGEEIVHDVGNIAVVERAPA